MLLATTRLRKSEALALLWSDINFKKKPVDVNKTSANRVWKQNSCSISKSADSKRITVLTDHMASILLEYHRKNEVICPIIFHKESGKYLNLSRPQAWLKSIYKYLTHNKKTYYCAQF